MNNPNFITMDELRSDIVNLKYTNLDISFHFKRQLDDPKVLVREGTILCQSTVLGDELAPIYRLLVASTSPDLYKCPISYV